MQFIYSRQFKKQFARLPGGVRHALRERLLIFADNDQHPILNRHRLAGEYQNYYSINITGDHRLVFEILSGGVYYLVAIGTHSKLYGE